MSGGTLNKVMLIGHLGDNVKTHYFEGGGVIGRFPLATNETFTNKNTGEKTTTTEWHNIVVKNKLAEICEKYLVKGDKIYCEGKIKTREWELDGIKKYTVEIQVHEMNFLSQNSKNQQTISNQQTPNPGDIIDDLPF